MVHKQSNRLLLALLVAFGSLGVARSVAAQATYPSMPQQRSFQEQPKLSPYLNLLRNDDSLLSPYHSFVLPQRDFRQQQARQALEINRLEQAAFGRATSSGAERGTRLPTGNGGRFQSYLHFYSFNNRP